jgi:hypothetical protein
MFLTAGISLELALQRNSSSKNNKSALEASAQETLRIDKIVDFEAGLLLAQTHLFHLCSMYKYMHDCADFNDHDPAPKPARDSSKAVPDMDMAEATFDRAQVLVYDLIQQAHRDKKGATEANLRVTASQLIVCRARGAFEWAFANGRKLPQKHIDMLLGNKGVKGCLQICLDASLANAKDTMILLQIQCAEALMYAMQYEQANAASAVDGHKGTEELFRLADEALKSAATTLSKRQFTSQGHGHGHGNGLLWLAYQVRVNLLSCRVANIRSDRRLLGENATLLKSLLGNIPVLEQAASKVMIQKVGKQISYDCTCAAQRHVLLNVFGMKRDLKRNGASTSHWCVSKLRFVRLYKTSFSGFLSQHKYSISSCILCLT